MHCFTPFKKEYLSKSLFQYVGLSPALLVGMGASPHGPCQRSGVAGPPAEAMVSRGANSKPGRVGDFSLHVPLRGNKLHGDQFSSISVCLCLLRMNSYKIHVSATHSEVKIDLPFRYYEGKNIRHAVWRRVLRRGGVMSRACKCPVMLSAIVIFVFLSISRPAHKAMIPLHSLYNFLQCLADNR